MLAFERGLTEVCFRERILTSKRATVVEKSRLHSSMQNRAVEYGAHAAPERPKQSCRCHYQNPKPIAHSAFICTHGLKHSTQFETVGKISRLRSPSERADVKLIERSRNLSEI
jgi:hypothetical protein